MNVGTNPLCSFTTFRLNFNVDPLDLYQFKIEGLPLNPLQKNLYENNYTTTKNEKKDC